MTIARDAGTSTLNSIQIKHNRRRKIYFRHLHWSFSMRSFIMYHLFTSFYIILFGIKLVLLKDFDVFTLGDRVKDIIVVCGPASVLLSEYYLVADKSQSREQYRPFIHLFDLFLQTLFVAKVIYCLCTTSSGRTIANFVKSRLLIGPSAYA